LVVELEVLEDMVEVAEVAVRTTGLTILQCLRDSLSVMLSAVVEAEDLDGTTLIF